VSAQKTGNSMIAATRTLAFVIRKQKYLHLKRKAKLTPVSKQK
jgi:hypothetical protein